MSANKQLQPTVTPNRWRGASASFHYALARAVPAHRERLNCGVRQQGHGEPD
jgi:hypothetical protein